MKDVRTIAALALVALLVPAAAGAQAAEIAGPAKVVGKGFFGGELELAMADGQRAVRFAGRRGYIAFLDLGGDLKVRCAGKGRAAKKATAKGMVYLCAGRGRAMVLGSHFKFRGFAKKYRALLPDGVKGTFNGRFVLCTKADEESAKVCTPEQGEPGESQGKVHERLQEKLEAARERAKERAKVRRGGAPVDSQPEEPAELDESSIDELAEALSDQ